MSLLEEAFDARGALLRAYVCQAWARESDIRPTIRQRSVWEVCVRIFAR
jgi:hypothetical protein